MSTTYWSWTLTLPEDALTFTAPRFVHSDLPDAIADVLNCGEALGGTPRTKARERGEAIAHCRWLYL